MESNLGLESSGFCICSFFFFFSFLLGDGNGLGKILLKISTVYKNSCCQVSTVFLQLIVALKGII